MKKLYSLAFFILALFSSCEEDLVVFDSENGPILAQFNISTVSLPTPLEGGSTDISVLVSTVSSQDRNIDIEISETSTTTDEQFVISNLVVPAGEYQGKVTITSNFDALPEEGSVDLILKLKDVGNSTPVIENGTVTVSLFRSCPLIVEEIVGQWSGTGVWIEIRDYTSRVETSLNENGELMINGILHDWFEDPTFWSEVIITSEPVKIDIDPISGNFVIEEQPYVTTTYLGNPQPEYSIKATGNYNSCDKTMQIFPILIQSGSEYNGANFGGPVFEQNILFNN